MNKAIISCPNCNNRMRIPSDKRIRFNCSACKVIIEAEHGNIMYSIDLKDQKNNNNENKFNGKDWFKKLNNSDNKPVIILISTIGCFLFLFLIYSLWTAEKKSYNNILKRPKTENIQKHLDEYKDGKYTDPLTLMRDSIYYHRAMNSYNSVPGSGDARCISLKTAAEKMETYKIDELRAEYERCMFGQVLQLKDFQSFNKYRVAFPESQYLDSIDVIENQLWEGLENQYKERSQQKNITKSKSNFVIDLLKNAREKDERNIDVIMKSAWDLKDWDDYTAEERSFVDTLTQFSNLMSGVEYPMPSTNPPPSIESKFRHINNSSQKKIVAALQSRLDSLFIPNLFVLSMRKEFVENERPSIIIDYKVVTLAEKYKNGVYPSLYVHTEERWPDMWNSDVDTSGTINRSGRFKGYLLATSIEWDFTFYTRNAPDKIRIESSSRPNNSFSGLKTQNDAYRLMMESAYQNYADNIANELGF